MNILINTMILVLPTISEYSIVEEVKRKNTCKFVSTPTAISKLFIVFNFDAGSKHSFRRIGGKRLQFRTMTTKTDRVMTDIYVFSYYFACFTNLLFPLNSFVVFPLPLGRPRYLWYDDMNSYSTARENTAINDPPNPVRQNNAYVTTKILRSLTLYTPRPVSILLILFSIHFLWC